MLNDPGEVSVTPRNTATELVTQTVHLVEQHHKRDLISHIIRESGWHQVLVFTRTKHGANRLAEKLVKDGLTAAAIHGNKSQSARTRALAGFKDGTVTVLVATDIAARGLDIDQLPQVVNFELPNVPEDYVHRIGRTGRAGATGAAVSLVDNSEIKLLKDIERLIKKTIERKPVADWTPPATSAAAFERQERDEDSRQPRGGGRNGGRGGNAGAPRSRPANAAPRNANGGRAPAPARAGGDNRGSQGQRDGKPSDRPAHAGRGDARPQQNHRRPEGSARPAGNGGRPAGGPRAALLSK